MYAHRRETPQHEAARAVLEALAEGPAAWGLPVFVIGEFLRVATHPRVLSPPSTSAQAMGAIEALPQSPSIRVLSPGARYWTLLSSLMAESRAVGNLVMDAQIAAVCLEHGASTILTEDRDFRRFHGVGTRGLR